MRCRSVMADEWLGKGGCSDKETKRTSESIAPMVQVWCHIYCFYISDIIFYIDALHLKWLISILVITIPFYKTLKVHSLTIRQEHDKMSPKLYEEYWHTLIPASHATGLQHCKCLLNYTNHGFEILASTLCAYCIEINSDKIDAHFCKAHVKKKQSTTFHFK